MSRSTKRDRERSTPPQTPAETDVSGAEAREDPGDGVVVEALRAQRAEPEEPWFWDGLHQRIMNEVAVTPLPGENGLRPPARGLLGRWLAPLRGGAWRRGLGRAALVTAAVTALTLLVLSRDQPQEPMPSPSQAAWVAPPRAPAAVDTLSVPEELWQAGFFQHLALDTRGAWATEQVGMGETGEGWDDAWAVGLGGDDEVDWLSASWDAWSWESSDPAAAQWSLGVEGLGVEELLLLDELLGG